MPQTTDLLLYIMWISAIGIVAMLIGVITARILRKRLWRQQHTEAFTIQDLRDMRADGEITPEEYERMRAALISRAVSDTPGSGSSVTDTQSAADRKKHQEATGSPRDSAPDE